MRTPTHATHAMVATSDPHAARAGKQIFAAGGNAVDAAIATAAALTVSEATSNGIGADAFAIVRVNGTLYGLTSSGKSPTGLTYEAFSESGKVPRFGFKAVTVPGAVKLWKTLHARFGKLPFEDLFRPAIQLADDGFKLADTVKHNVLRAKDIYTTHLKDPIFEPFLKTFFDQDVESLYRLSDHAKTLKIIANDPDSFYRGALMQTMVQHMQDAGGYLREADFLAHEAQWQTPLAQDAFGATLYELPPNGQGIIALKALSIFQHVKGSLHGEVESLKHAFVAGKKRMHGMMSEQDIHAYLDADHSKRLAAQIGDHAEDFKDPFDEDHGTVYLATADDTMEVSLIQSNYMGYGSGIVVPGTGIALQNRGAGFLLKEHPNQYAPGKRPYHTLMPGFMKTSEGIGPLGVMGGFMQPQGHYQVFLNHVKESMNIQAALDAPRYYYDKGLKVDVEADFHPDDIKALKKAGHDVHVTDQVGLFGRGQIILKTKDGLLGATEKRCDGTIETL